MDEWTYTCSNCGEKIDPELDKYFLYDARDGTYLCLCESCLDEHTHY